MQICHFNYGFCNLIRPIHSVGTYSRRAIFHVAPLHLRAYFGRLHRLICSVSIIPSILSRFFLWLLQRSRMMALKSSLHRKSVYNECLSTKKILWIELIDNSLVMIESRQVAFFRAKLLRPGGTSSDATLAVGVLAGSLPQFLS